MIPKVLNVRQLCPNKNCLSTGGRWKWEPKGLCVWSRARKIWGEASRNGGPLYRQCEKCCRRNSCVSMRVTILMTPNNGGFKAWTGLLCNQQCFQWVVGTPTKPQNVQPPICTYKMCWGNGGIELWKWPNNDWLNLRHIPGEGTNVYPALPTWPGTKCWLLQRTKIEKKSIQWCLTIFLCNKSESNPIAIREVFPGGWWSRCRDPQSRKKDQNVDLHMVSPNEALGTL